MFQSRPLLSVWGASTDLRPPAPSCGPPPAGTGSCSDPVKRQNCPLTELRTHPAVSLRCPEVLQQQKIRDSCSALLVHPPPAASCLHIFKRQRIKHGGCFIHFFALCWENVFILPKIIHRAEESKGSSDFSCPAASSRPAA